ncbi:hypothetical protein Daus18300_004003 [Diaporthe australafricana]|uniref:Helicase C-terminal domain-containing protein n=1 Tax=Diaporthe australafricana TaxID=127596 RepID=A0ABR3XC27_9PEZI
MSQQPRNTAVFRRPANLEIIADVLELQSIPKYVVCSNKANYQSGRPIKSPQEVSYTIDFFGDLRELIAGQQPFDKFAQVVRTECGVAACQTIWATSNLDKPAERVDSNKPFFDGFVDFQNSILRDPTNKWILYFFVQFDNDIAPKHTETSPALAGPSRDAPLPIAQPTRANTTYSLKGRVNTLKVAVSNVPGTVKDLISPRRPEEQSTVLTRLAGDIEQEHYLTSLLPKTNSPGGALIHVPSSSMPGWIEILEDCRFTPETYIFVTPHNSTKLRELYTWQVKDLSPAPQRAIFPPGGLYAFSMGLTFIDEAHKVLNLDSLPMELAQVHRHVLPSPASTTVSDLWLVTGTPFGGQMKDLADAIGFLAPDRAKDATALLAAHKTMESAITRTPQAVTNFEALFNKVFGSGLVIRDEVDTTFRGYPITEIQKVRPQYISRRIPNSQLQSVQSIINTKVTVGPRNAYFETLQMLSQNTQLLYLLSTFPSAAKILQDSPNSVYLDLDVRRLIRLERSTTGESLAGNKNLRTLVEQLARSPRSPKLQYILDELDRMAKDVTQRPKVETTAGSIHVETDQTLKKMVIITPTVFTAVMMYLILARFHPQSGPLLYHEDLKQSQRSEVLRRFNSLRKRDGPWRCLIAPASVASEALNLQIANRLILTSPLLNSHQESQALARVNRVGQTLKVHLNILLHEDSPIDRIIIAHRAGMKFRSDPFNVEEGISVAK